MENTLLKTKKLISGIDSTSEHKMLGIYKNIQKEIKTFSLIPCGYSRVNKYSNIFIVKYFK